MKRNCPKRPVFADAVYSSAFFVNPQQQGNLRLILIPFQGICHFLAALGLEIPGEQQVSPQVVLGYVGCGVAVRAARKEHLPNLFLKGHPIQDGLGAGFGQLVSH